MSRANEQEERSAAAGSAAVPPRAMWPLAIFVFSVFYLAEPHSWRFSASDAMHLNNSDESVQARVAYNIAKHQSGSVKRRIGVGLLGGFGVFCLLARQGRRLRVRGALGWVVVAFLAWVVASALWSIDPPVTLRRQMVFCLVCLSALGLVRRYSLEELARLTLWVTGFMMVGGLLCEVGLGSFKPWQDEYRFSGLTWPAFSCWNASLFVVAGLTLTQAGRSSWRGLVLAAFGSTLALLTKTRTGAAALVLALLFHVSSTWSAMSKVLLSVGTGLAISLTLLVVSFADVDVGRLLIRAVNLGREESAHGFSGRAGVWGMLLPYILERPIQGYGYETFWTENHLREIGERNWGAPDAHNGYINLTLGLGVVGSGLYFVGLGLAMLRSRNDFLRSLHPHDLYPASVTFLTAINALSVANQLNPHVMSYASIVMFAYLGFAADDRSAPPERVAPQRTTSTLYAWQPAEQVGRPL